MKKTVTLGRSKNSFLSALGTSKGNHRNNQVLEKPNAIAARLRLSKLSKHTSNPVIVESINSLQIKMMYLESSNQVDKIFEDRLEHKIMTQPVYHV